MKQIDIVDIKREVKSGHIWFEWYGERILCHDSQSGECACVKEANNGPTI